MKFSKTVVRLAAAALVVAGVVAGTVWAQASPLAGAQTKKEAIGVMAVGYNSKTVASGDITATPSAWDPADTLKFFKFNAWADTAAANAFQLGTVEVTYSGAANWDVELSTAFGGRLRKGGVISGAPLLKSKSGSATANDTVRLGLQLGIDKNGSVKAPAPVDSTWLKASNTVPIGFSKVFGQKRTLATDTVGLVDTLGGKLFAGGTPTGQSINDLGFVKPLTAGAKVKFAIRAGLGFNNSTSVLRGNDAAVYADTVRFTLLTRD